MNVSSTSGAVSAAQYPKGIDFDLDQMERTFGAMPDDIGSNFDYMFGPQRPSLAKTGLKMDWELQESVVNEDRSVVQVYTRKAKDDEGFVDEDGSPVGDVDSSSSWFGLKIGLGACWAKAKGTAYVARQGQVTFALCPSRPLSRLSRLSICGVLDAVTASNGWR
jgi:hypothetical protein